jgi:hypothetical protein
MPVTPTFPTECCSRRERALLRAAAGNPGFAGDDQQRGSRAFPRGERRGACALGAARALHRGARRDSRAARQRGAQSPRARRSRSTSTPRKFAAAQPPSGSTRPTLGRALTACRQPQPKARTSRTQPYSLRQWMDATWRPLLHPPASRDAQRPPLLRDGSHPVSPICAQCNATPARIHHPPPSRVAWHEHRSGGDRARCGREWGQPRDPHPMVVTELLTNPKTTEDDVVRLAAFRPARATSIEAIARTRWLTRRRVRMTVLLNPGSPPRVSLPLVGLCTRTELLEVARGADVHQQQRGSRAFPRGERRGACALGVARALHRGAKRDSRVALRQIAAREALTTNRRRRRARIPSGAILFWLNQPHIGSRSHWLTAAQTQACMA